MAKPFDAATKQLVELGPVEWLHFLGLPGTEAETIDADLAAITTDADRVIQVTAPTGYIAHIEFQTSSDGKALAERLLRYNVLLGYRHGGQSVQSAAVLLTRKADSAELTGRITRNRPDGSPYLWFEYGAIRLWQLSPNTLLNGDVSILPLVPLTRVSRNKLPGVVRRMEDRLTRANAPLETARTLWAVTYLLMGVSYSADFVDNLLKGVQQQLEDSSTYQALLAKGEAKGREEGREEGQISNTRDLILRLGGKRFGTPSAQTVERLNQARDKVQLTLWADRLLEVESWSELLA